MESKRGQVAIFVIIALVIVGGILIFFFLRPLNPLSSGSATFSPEQYMEQCAHDSVNEVIEQIMPQGGFLEPTDFKTYNDTKISYLCRSYDYYIPCVNQHPMLINEMGEQIKSHVSPIIESCFDNMKKEVERRQGSVEIDSSKASIDVSMAPGEVLVSIGKSVKITEKETIRTFDKFDVKVFTPIYDLARIAMNIADNERKYCYFEYVGYMALDQSVDISKFVMSDSTKIYSIKDRSSGKIFNTAIRGCAIPA